MTFQKTKNRRKKRNSKAFSFSYIFGFCKKKKMLDLKKNNKNLPLK